MADDKLEDGAIAGEGKTAEEIAAEAAAAEENLNPEGGEKKASPEDGGEGGEQKLSEEEKASKTADASDQFEKTGTWPEDTPEWVKKRINKQTRKTYAEKQRADNAEGENAKLREENEKLKNAPKELGEKPNLDDFDSEQEFMEALTDWKMDKRDQESAAKNQENEQLNTEQDAKKAFEKKMDKMMDDGQEKHEDFLQKVQSVPGNIFRQDVVDAIAEDDNAADLAYFLADNLAEAAKISELNPTQRALALGKISARLTAPPTKKPSNAPEPIPAGGSKANGPVDESKLSDDEFFAKRDAARVEAAAAGR